MHQLFFNRALRILLTTNSLILVAAAMLGPIYALFVKEIGGDLLEASLTGATFALAAGATTLISGRYSDIIKRNEFILVLGYGLVGTGFLLYTGVHSIWSLLFVQVLIGVDEAIYAPAFDSLYTYHVSPHKAGREWAAWEATNYFATAAGAIFGGVIAATFGFNMLFIIMAILCFASAIYIYLLPRQIL